MKNIINLKTFIGLVIIMTIFGCGGGGGGGSSSDSIPSSGVSSGGSGSGSATLNSVNLSWAAPTTNVDGSALTDLAGYKVHYGPSSNNYTQSVTIGNITGASISDLPDGIWCFAVSAYDTSGNDSSLSNETCQTLS